MFKLQFKINKKATFMISPTALLNVIIGAVALFIVLFVAYSIISLFIPQTDKDAVASFDRFVNDVNTLLSDSSKYSFKDSVYYIPKGYYYYLNRNTKMCNGVCLCLVHNGEDYKCTLLKRDPSFAIFGDIADPNKNNCYKYPIDDSIPSEYSILFGTSCYNRPVLNTNWNYHVEKINSKNNLIITFSNSNSYTLARSKFLDEYHNSNKIYPYYFYVYSKSDTIISSLEDQSSKGQEFKVGVCFPIIFKSKQTGGDFNIVEYFKQKGIDLNQRIKDGSAITVNSRGIKEINPELSLVSKSVINYCPPQEGGYAQITLHDYLFKDSLNYNIGMMYAYAYMVKAN